MDALMCMGNVSSLCLHSWKQNSRKAAVIFVHLLEWNSGFIRIIFGSSFISNVFSIYKSEVPFKADHHGTFPVTWISWGPDAVSVLPTFTTGDGRAGTGSRCVISTCSTLQSTLFTTHVHAQSKVTDCILVPRGVRWMSVQLCGRQRTMVAWWKKQREQAGMTTPLAQNLLHFHIWASLEKEWESIDGRNVMINPIQLKIRCFWEGFSWSICCQTEIVGLQLKNRQYCRLGLVFIVFCQMFVSVKKTNRKPHVYIVKWHDLFSVRFFPCNTVNFIYDFFFFFNGSQSNAISLR